MNPVRPDKNIDVLCNCSGTTEQQIRQLINEGITDPERLSRITGACSGCGSCEPSLVALLNAESLKEPLA